MPTPRPPPKGGGWGSGVPLARRGYPRFEFAKAHPSSVEWLQFTLERHSRPSTTCEKVTYPPGTYAQLSTNPRNRDFTFVHISHDVIQSSTKLSEINPPKQVLDLLSREINAAANVSGLRAEATWFLTIFSVSPDLPASIRVKALRHVMVVTNSLWRGSSFGLRTDEQNDYRAQAFWSDPSSGFIVVGSDSPFVAARQRTALEFVAISEGYKRLITPPPPTPIELVVSASEDSPVQPSRCALSMAVKPFGALVKVARVGTAYQCFISPLSDSQPGPCTPLTVSITEVSNNPFIDLSRPIVLTITAATSTPTSSRDLLGAQVARPSGNTPDVIPPPSQAVMSDTTMVNRPPSPATTLDLSAHPSGGVAYASGPQPAAKLLKPPCIASSSSSADEASSSAPAGDSPLVASLATTPHTENPRIQSMPLPSGSPEEPLAFSRKDDLVSLIRSPAPQSGSPASANQLKKKKKLSPKAKSLADFHADVATTLPGASPPLKKPKP